MRPGAISSTCRRAAERTALLIMRSTTFLRSRGWPTGVTATTCSPRCRLTRRGGGLAVEHPGDPAGAEPEAGRLEDEGLTHVADLRLAALRPDEGGRPRGSFDAPVGAAEAVEEAGEDAAVALHELGAGAGRELEAVAEGAQRFERRRGDPAVAVAAPRPAYGDGVVPGGVERRPMACGRAGPRRLCGRRSVHAGAHSSSSPACGPGPMSHTESTVMRTTYFMGGR